MAQIERYIKGSEFPKSLLKKLGFKADLNQYFKIIPMVKFCDGFRLNV